LTTKTSKYRVDVSQLSLQCFPKLLFYSSNFENFFN
jgi:hypothetical protein